MIRVPLAALFHLNGLITGPRMSRENSHSDSGNVADAVKMLPLLTHFCAQEAFCLSMAKGVAFLICGEN